MEDIPLSMTLPTPSYEDEKKYADLLKWLKETKVLVREDYVGDSKQPIHYLFGRLGLFYKFIQEFITFKKSKGKAASRLTVDMMDKIIREMDIEYKKIPRTDKGIAVVGSPEYQQFLKAWQAKFGSYLDKYKDNEFLMSFLEDFGNLYNRDIWFDLKKLQNFLTLFSEINNWDDGDPILDELYETYCGVNSFKYSRWYTMSGMMSGVARGGRKLTRRRKSNPKSKSNHYNKDKHKHKRRSYKKSGYRRQRH